MMLIKYMDYWDLACKIKAENYKQGVFNEIRIFGRYVKRAMSPGNQRPE